MVKVKVEAIKPEHVRKAAMNAYADLQIFKLKVVVVLGFLVWAINGYPGI